MLTGLLIDCDGVLADSEPLNHRCWSEAFAVHLGAGLRGDPREIVGLDLEQLLALGCAAAGIDPATLGASTRDACLAHKARLFRAQAPGLLRPVPGAARLVSAARARAIPCAVVSAALRARLLYTLELIGLAGGWQAILAGEDLLPATGSAARAAKDWPGAAARLGTSAATCAAIDDSAAGVASARAAGVGRVVGVATTLTSDELRAAGADRVVATPADIDLDALAAELA